MKMIYSILSAAVYVVLLNAAAENYSFKDYQSFCIMQRLANAHFDLIEHENQRLRDGARGVGTPASYWLEDSRRAEPDLADNFTLKQGVLFNPKTRTLYSKFGAWCFAPECMYKCARIDTGSIIPKDGGWQGFREKLITAYYVELVAPSGVNDGDDIYELHKLYGDEVPAVEFEQQPIAASSFEEPLFEEGPMLAESAREIIIDEVVPATGSYRVTSKLPFQLIRTCITSVVNWWYAARPGEPVQEPSSEMLHVLEMARKRSAREEAKQAVKIERTESQERLLAIWREMKQRFEAERNNKSVQH